MTTNSPDPLGQGCAGCGAPAGTPCSPDCLGLAQFEDQVLGITDAPQGLPPEMQQALEDVIRAQARHNAAIDTNDLYVALTEEVDQHIVNPVQLETYLGGAEVPDDFAVWLSRCYQDSYRDTLNGTIGVINSADTPGEQAMHANLDQVGLGEARDQAASQAWDRELDQVRQMRNLAYPTLQQPAPATADPAATRSSYVPTLIVSDHSALAPKSLRLGNGDPTLIGYLPADGTEIQALAARGWQVEQPPTDRAAQAEWYETYGDEYSPGQTRRATPPDTWWEGFVGDLNRQHATATATLGWLQERQPDQLPAHFTITEVHDHGPIHISSQGRHLLDMEPLDGSGDLDLAGYLDAAGWRNVDPPYPRPNTSATASPGHFTHAHLTHEATQVKDRTEAALVAIAADSASHTALDAIHRGTSQTQRETPGRPSGSQQRPDERRSDEGLGR